MGSVNSCRHHRLWSLRFGASEIMRGVSQYDVPDVAVTGALSTKLSPQHLMVCPREARVRILGVRQVCPQLLIIVGSELSITLATLQDRFYIIYVCMVHYDYKCLKLCCN